MQERSDEQLMAAVMAGDQVALATLVSRHQAPLLGYLYRLVGGNLPLSEDLVQETLLHVLRQRTYQAGRPFKPWLYMIATNLARDYFKSAEARWWRRESDEEEMLLQLYDSAPGPEERALAAEQGSEVRAALAQLREEYRVVMVLRFYQGFSLQEIAETLHIPLGTVKSRLSVGVHGINNRTLEQALRAALGAAAAFVALRTRPAGSGWTQRRGQNDLNAHDRDPARTN
ncbi:MAG TPA: RNA polymerase sigma factor [Ktedonobacteraceae bacterium]|nr:RNA polymerase sigma factor [Ktedonobacteraceae bacterium]